VAEDWEIELEQSRPAVLATQSHLSPLQTTHRQDHPLLDTTQSQGRDMGESVMPIDDAGIPQGEEGSVDLQVSDTDVSYTTRFLLPLN